MNVRRSKGRHIAVQLVITCLWIVTYPHTVTASDFCGIELARLSELDMADDSYLLFINNDSTFLLSINNELEITEYPLQSTTSLLPSLSPSGSMLLYTDVSGVTKVKSLTSLDESSLALTWATWISDEVLISYDITNNLIELSIYNISEVDFVDTRYISLNLSPVNDYVSISPDLRRIAYVTSGLSNQYPGEAVIWDTVSSSMLWHSNAQFKDFYDFSWSNDGQSVFIPDWSIEGNWLPRIVRSDGSEIELDLTDYTESSFYPEMGGSWSPNNMHLTFWHDPYLYVYDVENKHAVRTCIATSEAVPLKWSLDNRFLAFWSYEHGSYLIMDVQTGDYSLIQAAYGTFLGWGAD